MNCPTCGDEMIEDICGESLNRGEYCQDEIFYCPKCDCNDIEFFQEEENEGRISSESEEITF